MSEFSDILYLCNQHIVNIIYKKNTNCRYNQIICQRYLCIETRLQIFRAELFQSIGTVSEATVWSAGEYGQVQAIVSGKQRSMFQQMG